MLQVQVTCSSAVRRDPHETTSISNHYLTKYYQFTEGSPGCDGH